MTDPAVVQALIDTQYTSFESTITTHQADFYAEHGYYWRGLSTHSAGHVPSNGAAVTADVGSAVASDSHFREYTTWPAATFDDPLYATVAIEPYEGSTYHGYVVGLAVLIDGDVWLRTINYGPEIWREHDWAKTKLAGFEML